MKRATYFLTLLIASISFFTACHPRPVADLALADVALKAAQKAKADALAPDAFRKAENFYLRAKKDFGEGYFDSSRKFANDARLMAEQAEFKSLQKQSQLKSRPSEEEIAMPPGGGPPGAGPGPGMAPGGPPQEGPQ